MVANAEKIYCSRCIMNTECDTKIKFNEKGECNHCQRYDDLIKSRVCMEDDREERLDDLVARIKRAGKGKEYDCIVGVSGGVDSTYVAYLSKKLGLRPLAVHFDNGWNSSLAVKNIESVLKKLNIDLVTYVVNWKEFKSLQLAFLKASVPDGEIPTDHGIDALVWDIACKYNLKYILSGMNFATESISVPDWSYGHSDWRYIKSVNGRHGTSKLKTYPKFGFLKLFYINMLKGVRIVSALNYIDYKKEEAKKLLMEELDWTDYGGKHFESIYTRFYQGYILPRKFNVDKRYGHLSDLINSGQLTRGSALQEIKKQEYSPALQEQDKDYVMKKLALTPKEFDSIMRLPVRSFRSFNNSYFIVQCLRKLVNILRAINLYPK